MAEPKEVSLAAADIPVSTLAVALLFGCNAVVLGLLRLGLWLPAAVEDDGGPGNSKRIPALQFTRRALTALSAELCVMGAIMGYVWVSENAPLYAHQQKEHQPDFFWFICLVILFFALGSLHQDPKSNDLVNRDQTEEWKGWMQTVFLLYHYFHASEVYNSVRVMISCYVWMTGFGNFSFFYIKRDYGFVRFAQMMWRLNFTVVFLCLVMNNMYVLYYICPLHTFYFLVVFATMRVASGVNHSKWGVRVKLAVTGVIIYLVWEFSPVFTTVFAFIPNDPHPGAAVGAYGIQYEWHFRSGLDHYSTFFGMLFALNFPQASLWIAKVESLPTIEATMIKTSVGAVLMVLFFWWATEVLPLPKLEFNSTNPYTFMIPLLTYIFFRNSTPWLRQVHLGVLATIGKYTLETYLLQHHVWLTSNAKTVLVLVPGYPKINLMIVTAAYFLLAQRLYRVTMVTRAMLVPEETGRALVFLGWIGMILGASGLVAWVLQLVALPWAGVVVVIAGSALLVHRILAWRVSQHAAAGMPLEEWEPTADSSCAAPAKRGPLVWFVAGMLAACAGLVWVPSLVPTGAPANAGPLRAQMHSVGKASCLEQLGVGKWEDRSRKACSSYTGPDCESHVWGWTNHVLEKSCGFDHFTAKQAAPLLAGRVVAFVGDEALYDIAMAVHTIADPDAGHAQVGKLAHDYTEDRASFDSAAIGGLPPGRTAFTHAPRASSLAAALKRYDTADLVVLGLWADDARAGVSPEAFVKDWAAALSKLKAKMCMVVLPPCVFEHKLLGKNAGKLTNKTATSFRDALRNSPQVQNACEFLLPLESVTCTRARDSLDGWRFGPATTRVSAQILLNAIHQVRPAEYVAEEHSPGKTTPAKGKGGGVAQNPMLGLVALGVAALMLITMDPYAGISFFALRLIPSTRTSVSWEEAVRALHAKIGIDTYDVVGSPSAIPSSRAAELTPVEPERSPPSRSGSARSRTTSKDKDMA